jgi:hypothetical protein
VLCCSETALEDITLVEATVVARYADKLEELAEFANGLCSWEVVVDNFPFVGLAIELTFIDDEGKDDGTELAVFGDREEVPFDGTVELAGKTIEKLYEEPLDHVVEDTDGEVGCADSTT